MDLSLTSHTFVYGDASVFLPFLLNFVQLVALDDMKLSSSVMKTTELAGAFMIWPADTIFLAKLSSMKLSLGTYPLTVVYL